MFSLPLLHFSPPWLCISSRMTICNLYTMPRVAEPVWLTMMSGTLEKNQLCGHFMKELSLLMEQGSKNQLSKWCHIEPPSNELDFLKIPTLFIFSMLGISLATMLSLSLFMSVSQTSHQHWVGHIPHKWDITQRYSCILHSQLRSSTGLNFTNMSHGTGREVDTCGLTCEVNHANKEFRICL